jgi:prepilin-type N-terminal cleavage/methylation domain-containing protein
VRQTRPGYTLFEVLLVMAVLVLLGTIALPSLDAMYADARLSAGVDGVRAAMSQARNQALEEGRPYRLAVIPGKGNYRIGPDSPDFWNGGNGPDSTDPDHPTLVREDALPPGVTFTTDPNQSGAEFGEDTVLPPGTATPDQWAPVMVYLPDGSVQDDGTTGSGYVQMTFRLRSANPVVLKVRSLTGVITAHVLRPGEDSP